jgi:biopolymer transport protein ExbD
VITRPLDLVSRLSPPPRDLGVFAWVNVGVIVLFFGLFGSSFVLAPGLPVGVGAEAGMVLPQVDAAVRSAGATSVVVTYRRDNLLLFEGGMYSLGGLRKPLEAYAQKHPGAVMLVRMDKQVSAQAFFDLCGLARAAGFANVFAAAESPAAAAAP